MHPPYYALLGPEPGPEESLHCKRVPPIMHSWQKPFPTQCIVGGAWYYSNVYDTMGDMERAPGPPLGSSMGMFVCAGQGAP